MNRLTNKRQLVPVTMIILLVSAAHAWTAPPAPPAGNQPLKARPKLYGFCMEQSDSQKRPLPQQIALLRELGFDGVGYPLWLDDRLEINLKQLDEAQLPVFVLYTTVNVDPNARSYDPRLPECLAKLKGRSVTICVLLKGFPPGDRKGMAPAVKVLGQLGEMAAKAGVRISIYHHRSDWTESLLFALEVANQVDHPRVGVNFNLCHWLMIDGDKDYQSVLRENASKIFAVTINGAQVGAKVWADGLIQPLDRGDFDNRQLLATLGEIGYRGPIGLMCYGIPGDAGEHLERSIKVWRTWHGK